MQREAVELEYELKYYFTLPDFSGCHTLLQELSSFNDIKAVDLMHIVLGVEILSAKALKSRCQ